MIFGLLSNSSNHSDHSTNAASSTTTSITGDSPPIASSHKEKFVSIYEQLFNNQPIFQKPSSLSSNGDHHHHREVENVEFWDELFLLKVNTKYLEDCIQLTSEEELLSMQRSILNPLFLNLLKHVVNVSYTRRINALLTLCVLFQSLFRKGGNSFVASNFSSSNMSSSSSGGGGGGGSSSSSFSVLNILNMVSGLQNADDYFKKLIVQCCECIVQEKNSKVQQLALALFVILLTGQENVNQNALIDYFMLVDVYDSLVHVLMSQQTSMKMKKNALVCLSILVNYRKYESMKENIYLAHLKKIEQPAVLMAFSDVITRYLSVWTSSFEMTVAANASIFTYVWNSLFSSATATTTTSSASAGAAKPKDVKQVSAMLLMLYELIHVNENFVGLLTRSLASIAANEDNQRRIERETSADVMDRLDERGRGGNVRGCPLILQQFLKYCSILFQEPHYINNYVKNANNTQITATQNSSNEDISTQYYSHFCLIIILCLVDKKVFRSFMFDNNVKLDFTLFFKEKGQFTVRSCDGHGSLAKIVFELLIQFLNHHMTRHHFSMEMYSKALSATHAILCLAKKFRIRFVTDWKQLWTSLIRICDVIAEGNCNGDKVRACNILGQVLTIFNFGILKGDLFFPSRIDQEEMIYQMIYHRQVFDKLSDWMERNLKKKNPVMGLLQNVAIIISDVVSQLELKHGYSYPSETEVLNIIRKVVPEISIVKISGLENREEYLENPNEITFFNRIMRLFVYETRTGIVDATFRQMNAPTS